MSNCPYCGSIQASDASSEATRRRPDTHSIRKCSGCEKYYISHENGRAFPLLDETDPYSDVCQRVRR